MHVTIIGAGALGQMYGVRLAAAGEHVSFVVRPVRAGDTTPFVLERAHGDRRVTTLAAPHRVTAVPASSSAVLVAVRVDQLEAKESLAELSRTAPEVPWVVLTPLFPPRRTALEKTTGRRLIPGIPSLAGYQNERGVVRYWLIRMATTWLDEPAGKADRACMQALARGLAHAGIATQMKRGAAAQNAATTMAFFPLAAAIDVGGGIDGLLAAPMLIEQTRAATRECATLGALLGPVAPWAQMLTRFGDAFTFTSAAALVRAMAPEVLRFLEAHFGPKLHAQHLAMGQEIVEMGCEHGMSMPALTRFLAALQAQPR